MQPVDPALVARVAREHGTPYYLYDAGVMRERLARLSRFDVVRYAQKACSNVHVLRLFREAGALVDAVSRGEIERALRAGFTAQGDPAGLVYTADVLDEATLARVTELAIPVNAGSPDMLEQLGRRSPGHRVWIRVNPGFGHGHSRKTNTGVPSRSTASGTSTSTRRCARSRSTASTSWACTCTSARARASST